jgi:hypothetical protein
MSLPQSLQALDAEAATISAAFADPSIAQTMVNLGLTNKHYGHPRVRPIADAIWACWAAGVPVSVFAVQEQLAKAGNATAVPESYLRSLYDAGDSAVVLATERNVRTIRIYAAARLIYASSEAFREQVAASPDELESLIAAHARELDMLAQVGQDDEHEGEIATINQAPMESPVGVPTGLAWFDLVSLGQVDGDIHGIQGGEKKGKSRFTCALTLGSCQHNVFVDQFCTDGTSLELRNRLACLIGTNLLRKWGVPEDEWLLNPRRLFRSQLSDVQNDALNQGRDALSTLPLRVFDMGNGIGDFETLFRKIRQGAHRARQEGRHYTYIIDHLADIEWANSGASGEWGAWRKMLVTLKEFTISTPGVTGIWVNQRDEQTNKQGGKNAGSGGFMGGKFGQTVVFLWEMAEKTWPDWMGIRLKRSRWGDGGNPDNFYPIEPNSGYIKERSRLPVGFWVPFAGMERPAGPVERYAAREAPVPAADDFEVEAANDD